VAQAANHDRWLSPRVSPSSTSVTKVRLSPGISVCQQQTTISSGSPVQVSAGRKFDASVDLESLRM